MLELLRVFTFCLLNFPGNLFEIISMVQGMGKAEVFGEGNLELFWLPELWREILLLFLVLRFDFWSIITAKFLKYFF